jgi:hypothetical protein
VYTTSIPIEATSAPFGVIVEPWAFGFEARVGVPYRVVFTNFDRVPAVSCDIDKGKLILTTHSAGTTFTVYRGDDETEMAMPIASI